MKIGLLFISTLLVVVPTCALPWVSKPRARLECTTSALTVVNESDSPLHKALELRGGDGILGSPITHKGLSTLATGFWASVGLLSESDGNKFWNCMGGVQIEPGSLAEWAAEHLGWGGLGVAKLCCLALFTDFDVLKAAALAGIPCFLFFFKGMYSGSMEKLGFYKAFAPGMLLYLIFLMLAAFTGSVDASIVKPLVWGPPGAMGAVGYFFPSQVAQALGISSLNDMDRLFWTFQSMALVPFSALAWTLLSGSGDPIEAVRNASIAFAVQNLYLRFAMAQRWTKAGVEFNPSGANFFTGYSVVTAGLMLLEETSKVVAEE